MGGDLEGRRVCVGVGGDITGEGAVFWVVRRMCNQWLREEYGYGGGVWW